MKYRRSSGVLLHPTSLPGLFGIGDLGPQAYHWIDFLAESGCGWWQVLPLGPTGYGDSPYQSFSAFAGNPYLISPELLQSENLLDGADLDNLPSFHPQKVDYGRVIEWKNTILMKTFERWLQQASSASRDEVQKFKEINSFWLDDFALFMALKEAHNGAPWHTWHPRIRNRDEEALRDSRLAHYEVIQRHVFVQYLFYKQWQDLHAYAKQKHIGIIGDLPIFVSHDSADVWMNPELFFLKKDGKPQLVAGVPPDYFSPTGQLWGNPIYRWEVHRRTGYAWWISRLRMAFTQVDTVRLDHFRGFAGYWEIPGNALTAENGRWVRAPGTDFFKKVQQALGNLPIIAEDLGVITEDVIEMREKFAFPGMKILQFGFAGEPNNPYLPHNYPRNCVVYTGTHDNDTALGWYQRINQEERNFALKYLNQNGTDFAWDLIRACWASVADLAIAPMQDFLSLDNRARMNYPGNPRGNWQWRLPSNALSSGLSAKIQQLNYLYSRSPL